MIVSNGPDFEHEINDIRSKISHLPTSYRDQSDIDHAIRDLKDALLGMADVLARFNAQLNQKKS